MNITRLAFLVFVVAGFNPLVPHHSMVSALPTSTILNSKHSRVITRSQDELLIQDRHSAIQTLLGHFLDQNNSPVMCNFCINLVTELKRSVEVYQDDSSYNSLSSSMVDRLCEVLPFLDNCNENLNTYITTAIRAVNPGDECIQIGACDELHAGESSIQSANKPDNNTSKPSRNPLQWDTCTLCARTANFMIRHLRDPVFMDKVETFLDAACDTLHVMSYTCKLTVHDYIMVIMDTVSMTYLSGETLCEWVYFNVLRIQCDY